MQIQSYRTIPQNQIGLDIALAIAGQNNPWLVEDLPFRLVEVLKSTPTLPQAIVLDTRATDKRWGLQLDPDTAFININGCETQEIVDGLSVLDIKLNILN